MFIMNCKSTQRKGRLSMVINTLHSIHYLSKFIITDAFSFQLLEKHVYYIILMGVIFVSYIVIVPFIRWLVTLYSIQLLSYLMSSLLIITFIVLGMYVRNDLKEGLFNVLEITFHCLSIFGMILLIYHLSKRILDNQRKRSS